MSRPIVPAAPAPPPLAKLRELTAARDSSTSQSSAPPLPNGTSRPQLQRQLHQSMLHTQNTPPPLPPEKSRSQSVKAKGPPSLPPGKPRAHSVESKCQAPPPPPPQRTKPRIQRQDQDRRDSGAPPPLPARTDQRPVAVEQGQGRAISINQGQGHRGPPPLPPRDRAVSMEEKSSRLPQIRDRKLSEPTHGEPHGAPPPLPQRPLKTIPAEPSPAATGSTTCVVNCMTQQSLKSQASFEDQFIFTPVSQLPAPEAFVAFTKVYPSELVRATRGIPP